ncbi:hypothetical protein H4R21_005372, partial [Coemansia helicoidea]
MAPRLGAAQIHQLGRVQQLQTVAVEASSLLRGQTVHVLQTHNMRLEEMADTELEDADSMGQCLSELMLGVLYTELRKDVRQVTDALDRLQYETLSGRCKPDAGPMRAAEHAWASGDTSTDEMVTAGTHEASTAPSVDAGYGEDPLHPPPLSAVSETFRTARGAPMGLTAALADSEDEGPAERAASEQHTDRTAGGDAPALEELARRLRDACLEVEEWRRTPCIAEFIVATAQGTAQTNDAGSSAASPRLAQAARLVEEAHSRRRRA